MSSGIEVKDNYFELKSMQIKKEYSFIYLNTYAQLGLDVKEGRQQDVVITTDYYMILDVALSVVMDLQFMNEKYAISQDEYEVIDIDPETTILDDTRPEVKTLLTKIPYNEHSSSSPCFGNSELLLIQDTICKYYGTNISRYEKFIEEYTRLYNICKDADVDITNAGSIWDAKNYSLHIFIVLLSSFHHNNFFAQNYYIGIYSINDTPIGHIFYVSHPYQRDELKSRHIPYNIEAIGIQQSFVALLSSKKYNTKPGVSKILFDEIVKNTLYKNARYMYALAWPEISKTLVEYYGFTSIKMQFCLKTKRNCEMQDIKDIFEHMPQDIHIPEYLHQGNYIYTYKKITDEERTSRD